MIQIPPSPPTKPTSVDDPNGMALDPENGTIPQERSEIVTLTPFEQRNKKRRNFKVDPTLIHFNHIFGANNWSRFLVLKTERRISPLVLENKLLSLCPTREMCFRPQKTNEWLIEATTKAQSDIFLKIEEIQGIKVSVKSHDMLNYIQGTVVLPQIDEDEEIPDKTILLDSLKLRYDNINNIEVFEIPNRKNHKNPIRIAKIKFIGQDLTQKIKILGQNREVRPYVPKPLQCKLCCKFGHTHKVCQNKEICIVCGSEEHTTNWKCPDMNCSNCGQLHHARSKECPFYMYNTELKLLMTRTGMAVREAKLELKVRGILDPGRNPSYKNILKGKTPQRSKPENNQLSIPNNLEISTNNKFEILGNVNTEPTQQVDEINAEIHDRPNVPPSLDIEEEKDEAAVHVPVELEMEDEIDITTKKRLRDQNSPPKVNENATASKKRIVKLNRQTASESELLDEITPSPVYQSRYLDIMKNAKEKRESKVCECQQCSLKDAVPEVGYHHGRCGCHNCFLKDCKETKPLTKDKLINVIRNFFSRKDSGESLIPLELHTKDCMCIKHLHFYRVNKISYLDKFLAKPDNRDSPNESSIDTEISKMQTENESAK